MSTITVQPVMTAASGVSAASSAGPSAADTTAAPAWPVSRPVSTRLHLTRRGRVVLTSLAAIPVIVGAVLFAVNGGAAIASAQSHDAAFSHVTVTAGESLWQIAETIAPAADPRDVITAIIDLNQLPNSLVVPGQSLAIPAEYAHARPAQ